ncbi:MAG: hypothetical protein CVV03_09255 [Firmicutes bacterium HGW-Firmicutes-8]|nr:MAG: hypothetical protein CVV03_09255 [Firmicutes bacterium HGW-Firmicutes-8]
MVAPKDTWTGRINVLTLKRLDEQINVLYRLGKYQDAARVAETALKTARETYGPNHPYVVTCRSNLAQMKQVCEDREVLGRLHAPSEAINPVKSKMVPKLAGGLLLAVIVFTWFIGGFSGSSSNNSQPVFASVFPAGSRPYYSVKADFYPERKMIEGEEKVIFECKEPTEEVIFNLYLNRYKNNSLNTSEIRSYALERGMDQGYIDILWVYYNRKTVSFKQEGELLRISRKDDVFSPGEHILEIGFRIKMPLLADRVGGNSRGIWLGNWLPTLSVDSKKRQPTEIGDSYINYSSTYEIEFMVPKEYTLVLSNTKKVRELKDARVYYGVVERVRDLPVFLTRGYKVVSAGVNGTQINYYYFSSDSRAREVLAAAQRAFAYFRSIVGEYPWKQLNIVENDMYLSGMEYSTLLLVSTQGMQDSLTQTVFHEVGHQWFYNIIGSDQYQAAFIDEGCVEFFASYALKNYTPYSAAKLDGLNRNLGDFHSWPEYRDVHYRNGRRLFETMYATLGKNEFENFIKEYYDRYKYGLVTRDEFKIIMEDKIGRRATGQLLN